MNQLKDMPLLKDMVEPSNLDKDYGTPSPISYIDKEAIRSGDKTLEMVTGTIDGQIVTVPVGTSVMRAAATMDVNIPKLCATDSLKAFGSCRLCVVAIEGRKGFPASCTTPFEADMVVATQNKAIAELRRNVMELYISDHPLDCLTCPTNGDCELQDMAGAVGLRDVRYGYDGANHLDAEKDESNPYFTFDPSKCIACSRCVRACEETQGTYALTIEGRGFESKVSASQNQDFIDSECVSCGACVQACPTATLTEKSIIEAGQPEHSKITTCGYCGVGCSFKAEMKGEEVVRMTPYKGGQANRGHSCVKGRFAFGYATHKERITTPMIRDSIDDEWNPVSWEEAFSFAAGKLKAIQKKYGVKSIGGISSSRCTNEEVWLVQKMVRAGFGNNNIDTCARVCHSPTGYGLKQTLGESAGTQNFDSVAATDVMMVMGANPTDAHPVFASRMKARLKEGAKLIVIDPRRIDLVDGPHVKANYHLKLLPGTNVAFINTIAHVIVRENLHDEDFVRNRCESDAFDEWLEFIKDAKHAPENTEAITAISAKDLIAAARLYATAGNGAIYYGLGVTEHSQGSTTVMGIANLAMLTGNIGRPGVGVNPLRGQNNVQGSCDMGSFPHELPGYRPVSDDTVRADFEKDWDISLDGEPGFRINNMFDAAVEGIYKGLYIQGEDVAQSDPNTHHVEAALKNLECLIVQDLFLNETAKFATVFLPGSSFLEKNGTFTNAERRISPVRKVIKPLAGLEDWEVTQGLCNALGYEMNYTHPREIMQEIARLTPTFKNVTYERIKKDGSVQWPCTDETPDGTPTMHIDEFVRGKGLFKITEFIPSDEKVTRRFPLILTTGRILSQYNVGAQTRRTDNIMWHHQDLLEIHQSDATDRGIENGDRVKIQSRSGDTHLTAKITERVSPGVVYTTFHHPKSGANIITTDNSDWATNCPEYKVTAVQIGKVIAEEKDSDWQRQFEDFNKQQLELAGLNDEQTV
ncbi:MAG: formate dehydrogenase subunit alpha [Arenicellaceae bacterium]|nr:formate dehydrogenase subunit alpha [Arenicellaceae bacterium]